jgi:hypothetical protein
MKRLIIALLWALLVSSFSPEAQASKTKALREAAERVVKGGGASSLDDATRRLRVLERTHGPGVVEAVKRSGHAGMRAIERAGPQADVAVRVLAEHGDDGVRVASDAAALRLISRHGDDAARALVRHPGVAGGLITRHGTPAAEVLASLSSRNARRLALLSDEGALTRAGRSDDVFALLIRRGDTAMDFLWRHKGVLAGGAALAAFLAQPDPYIEGIESLAQNFGDDFSAPAVAAATEAGRRTNWTLLGLVSIGLSAIAVAWWVRRRNRMLTVAQLPALASSSPPDHRAAQG